ncbi:unnamed protein product [Mycena citricolor]|uniref:ATPase AAA-type core domain-containing protein n=1 Tax=Mycena citricolor TaxID=2018698 RepID=A0AAD2GRQ7_9AGAR|nr:unnamed protein product [Mycena citricolor]
MPPRKKAGINPKQSKQQSLLDHFIKRPASSVFQTMPCVEHDGSSKDEAQRAVPDSRQETRGRIELSAIETANVVDLVPPESSSPIEILDVTDTEEQEIPSLPAETRHTASAASTPPRTRVSESIRTDSFIIDLTTPDPLRVSRPNHDIFAPRRKTATASEALPALAPTKPSSGSLRKSTTDSHRRPFLAKAEMITPAPNKENQHVRGHQSHFVTTAADLRGTPKICDPYPITPISLSREVDDREWHTPPPSETDIAFSEKKILESIPSVHQTEHPVIQRTCGYREGLAGADRLWSDVWRPLVADDVLGNEDEARYLRNWLQALEVRSEHQKKEDGPRAKRPQIIRTVSRPRKKRRLTPDDNGFVVSDASDYAWEPEPAGADDDDFIPTSDAVFGAGSKSDLMGNTILITGPPGCGKTAAVFACADELGWDVFEVYPGIGKRNGASLEALIGDVGKNHLVRRADHETRTGDPDAAGLGQNTPRQSLILLEEVDILFKEDHAVDLLSFVDAYNTRRDAQCPTALASAELQSSGDEETGHSLLVDALSDGFGSYNWDERIRDTLLDVTHGIGWAADPSPCSDYLRLVRDWANDKTLAIGVMARPTVHLDYIPWARHIVAGEDMQAEAQASLPVVGRGTRNSTRRFYRNLELDEPQRHLLHATALEACN